MAAMECLANHKMVATEASFGLCFKGKKCGWIQTFFFFLLRAHTIILVTIALTLVYAGPVIPSTAFCIDQQQGLSPLPFFTWETVG